MVWWFLVYSSSIIAPPAKIRPLGRYSRWRRRINFRWDRDRGARKWKIREVKRSHCQLSSWEYHSTFLQGTGSTTTHPFPSLQQRTSPKRWLQDAESVQSAGKIPHSGAKHAMSPCVWLWTGTAMIYIMCSRSFFSVKEKRPWTLPTWMGITNEQNKLGSSNQFWYNDNKSVQLSVLNVSFNIKSVVIFNKISKKFKLFLFYGNWSKKIWF